MSKTLSGHSDSINHLALDVAREIFDDMSYISLRGITNEVDPGHTPCDLWRYANIQAYIPDPEYGVAPASMLAGDNASDTGIDILIQGLDIVGNLRTQIVTLNGTTPVPLATPLWRTLEMINVGPGRHKVLAGNVILYDPNTDDVYAYIGRSADDISDGRSFNCRATIPRGFTGYVMDISASIGRASASQSFASIGIRVADLGRPPSLDGELLLGTDSSSSFDVLNPVYIRAEELTDIWIGLDSVTSTNTEVVGRMTILLEKKFDA